MSSSQLTLPGKRALSLSIRGILQEIRGMLQKYRDWSCIYQETIHFMLFFYIFFKKVTLTFNSVIPNKLCFFFKYHGNHLFLRSENPPSLFIYWPPCPKKISLYFRKQKKKSNKNPKSIEGTLLIQSFVLSENRR